MAALTALPYGSGAGERLLLSGQVSGWVEFNDETLDTTEVGARCIPEARLVQPLPAKAELDAVAAVDAYAAPVVGELGDIEDRSDVDL